MNSGLKNYTKQLKHSVGKATAHVNLFKRDANLHITVPLISTKGLSPFETSLIYNYQDRNENGFFGKGFKLNYHAKLLEYENSVTVQNSDGSMDEYQLNEWNNYTQMKATRVPENDNTDYHTEFEDRNGNKKIYDVNIMYPCQIVMKSGDIINIDMSSSRVDAISNGKGDVITFIPNSVGRAKEIIYSYNNTVLEKVKLLYNGEYIESIEYLTPDNVVINKLEFTYSTTQIAIKDTFSKYNSIFNVSNNAISSVVDYYETVDENGQNVTKASHTTSIDYYINWTKVTSWDGTYAEYYFDNTGIPLYQMDSSGYVKETEYNNQSKLLVAESNAFAYKHLTDDYFSGQSIEDFTLENVTRERLTLDEEKWPDILGNVIYKFSHSGNSTIGRVTFDVPVNCVATDNVVALLWARQKTNFDSNNGVGVKINMNIGDNDVDFLKKPITDDNFELIILGANCKKTEPTASFIIEMYGDSSFELGGIKVLRQDFGTFFEYDENTNNMTLVSKAGENAKMSYGSDNKLKKMSGFDSTIYNFEYNEDGYPTKSTSAYGVKIENEYSTSFPSRLVKQTLKDRSNSKIMETQKTYTDDGRLIEKEYDEMGVCIADIEYGDDYKLHKVTNPVGSIAPIGVTTEFNRENELLKSIILEKSNVEKSKAVYDYYDDRKLKSIMLKNGSKYEFFYDFRGNVTEIRLNGVLVFSYTYYENTGNIQYQKYAPTKDMYGFVYNDDNQIKEIYYFAPNSSTPKLCYTYSYDDIKRLTSIRNERSGIINTYTYDDNGKIITNAIGSNKIDYTYDNLGDINTILRKVMNTNIHESYSKMSRSQSEHPQKLKDRYFYTDHFCLFDENNATLKYNGNDLNPISSNFTFGSDGVLPYISMEANKPLAYQLTDLRSDNYEDGCIKFWFKPNNIDDIQYLFGCQSNTGEYITVYIREELIQVEVKSNGKPVRNVIDTRSKVLNNRWNFFALNFYSRSDDGNDFESEISFTLNSDTQFYRFLDYQLDLDNSSAPIYYIGRKYDGSSTECFTGQIACLAIRPRQWSTYDEINDFYNVTKNYIDDCQYVDETAQTLDVSETVVFKLSNAINNEFEIYPLNNNLLSIKGARPSRYTSRRGVVDDKDKAFNFNKITKRYAYVADGVELAYNWGQSSNATILMRAYTEATTQKQYLFEGRDILGKYLGLYRDWYKKLHVVCGEEVINTNLIMDNDLWHTVGISFQKTITDDSNNETSSGTLCIYLDGETETHTIPIDFAELEIFIGRRIEEEVTDYHTGEAHECYPFYGQIEMLCTSTTYVDVGRLDTLSTIINPMTKTTEFDDFGRVKQSCIYDSDDKVLTRTIFYDTRTDTRYTSQRIKGEQFKFGHTSLAKVYAYNNWGQIREILDPRDNAYTTYRYDDRGYLIRENNINFLYDDNGNITQTGTTVFTYDSIIKDRLAKVGENAITYSATSPLNPKAYKNFTYNFEGRRLVGLVKSSTSGNQTFTYQYDDQGLRIKKKTPSEMITYVYDGNKLISELGDSYRLEFLYDEYGELYGFIRNQSNKYFYVRDALRNIIGIVDKNGNMVVQYKYTAYGQCTIISNNMVLANLNPFRYKGYYYDNESGMYYCHSRYYVPEWCRWLNADSPNFLQLESLNGMNLFAYCGNDPINYSDDMGNLPKWVGSALKILGAVGVVLAVTALTVATAGMAAAALGASTAVIGAVVTGAAVGGLVSGGLEIGAQVYENGVDDIDLGSVAIESFTGSAYGAISGVSSTTTSAAARLAMRGAKVALGGLGTALHGINDGNLTEEQIIHEVYKSIRSGLIVQCAFGCIDAYTGKLSNNVLQLYKLDGALKFGGTQLLKMSTILVGKNINRNFIPWF